MIRATTKAERRACRKAQKAALRKLNPTPAATDDDAPFWSGDDLNFRFTALMCGYCGACPAFMEKRGFKRRYAAPQLQLVN